MLMRWRSMAAGVVLAVGATACGGAAPEASEPAAAGPMSEAPAQEAPAGATQAAEAGTEAGRAPGSATLTIGDEVWEFDSFSCVLGHENTRSDRFSFTTNSFQTFDGVDTQMQVTIADPSGTGQVTGDETIHRISFDDVSDFENPSIDWSMNTPNAVTIDGDTVTVEGLFNDGRTPEVAEEIPGTLVGTCS